MRRVLPGGAAWQSVALLAASACGLALPRPGLPLQLALCLPAIAVFGLPHGATDYAQARALFAPRHGARWLLPFVLLYGGLGACVAILAWQAPVLALMGFVAVATWHFGGEDAHALDLPGGFADRLTFGMLPVCAPALFWPAQTQTIVSLMGVPLQAATLHRVAVAALLVWAACALRTLARATGRSARLAGELCLTALLQAAQPPLIAFSVWFCAVHAPRHMATLPPALAGRERLAVSAAAVVLIALATWTIRPEAAGLQWLGANGLFWGLACLTLPHVVLSALAGSSHVPTAFQEHHA